MAIKMQSDGDHVDRLISCLYMALPFFVVRIFCYYIFIFLLVRRWHFIWTETLYCLQRGASSSKFLNYLNKHILPLFDKVFFSRKTHVNASICDYCLAGIILYWPPTPNKMFTPAACIVRAAKAKSKSNSIFSFLTLNVSFLELSNTSFAAPKVTCC